MRVGEHIRSDVWGMGGMRIVFRALPIKMSGACTTLAALSRDLHDVICRIFALRSIRISYF